MFREFKQFLIKQNALALAVAVVIGAALNKVVSSIVDDLLMPIVAAATPGGAWQQATLDVGTVAFKVGSFASAVLNFLIVGFVAWRISKVFLKSEPPSATPATRPCAYCTMQIDPVARRCPHCTSDLTDPDPTAPMMPRVAPAAPAVPGR
ncbi:MAG: MscL family protein [Gemmatimonadaceae bacterium]